MNSVHEIIMKLPSLIGVSLQTAERIPELYTVRDIMYNLQMSFYWLKSAKAEMANLTKSVEITSGEGPEHKLVIPTLIGTPEQLAYMKLHLTELAKGTFEYVNDTSLPHGVRHKVEQSYNTMMLALFNTELSTTYYEQIQQRGA